MRLNKHKRRCIKEDIREEAEKEIEQDVMSAIASIISEKAISSVSIKKESKISTSAFPFLEEK